jgi:Xaa-Pro aminopeptidase
MSAANTIAATEPSIFDRMRRERDGLLDEGRFRAEIAGAGLDAVIASSHANVIYTTGAYLPDWSATLFPVFIVTTASGERAGVVSEGDEEFIKAYLPKIRSYRFGPREEHDAVMLLRDVLAELGVSRSRVGVELAAVSKTRFEMLTESCAHVRWADARPVFDRTRLIKTPRELDVLGAAARVTAHAIDDAFTSAGQGTTEKALAARIQANALLAGADDLCHTAVSAGAHSILGIAIPLENIIQPEEVISVDFGANFGGYCTDMARNAVKSTPTTRQRDIYQRLFETHLGVLDSLRPGIGASEVFTRAQTAFDKARLSCAWGSIGHSIGLAIHEGFEIGLGSKAVLEEGMVICIELTHIEPGDARYHVEDMIAIKQAAGEILSAGGDSARMREIV